MRFIDTHTGQFIEQADPHVTIYAILSHTWDSEGEQTYRELQEIQRIYDPGGHRLSAINPTPTSMVSLGSASTGSPPASEPPSIWDDPRLSPKIRHACEAARKDGFRYIWIDSCCIEKQSSSELLEAINSMYAWYRDSKLCYAFLVDVSACGTTEDWKSQFSQSRWFRRGWTLQELIAPSEVVFLSKEWEPLGTKHDLAEAVEELTGIDQDVLKHELPLDCVSVAKRMSWASGRETTRVEDEAYSLLGIFDINMTTHYGEGRRAFRRLQEEILFRIPDQSLFAWGHVCPQQPVWPAGSGHQLSLVLPSQFRGPTSAQSTSSASFFASSPRDFPRSSAVKDLRSLSHDEFLASIKVYDLPAQEYSRTPYGIRTDLPLLSISNQKDSKHDWYIAILACEYHAPNSRGLLGRLCVSETPRFPETTPLQLASAYVRGEQMAPYGLLFIPSSWEIIGRLRNHIENLTVFFPHPGRELSPLQAVNMRDYRNGMHPQVIFTMWAGFSLREQGYCIKTNVFPGHDDIHQISLTKDDYSIHITYQYSSGPSGNMKWRAHIQVVSPVSSSTLSREEIHPDLCSDNAAKVIAIAVKRDQREGSEVVRLQSPAGREVILELRIELVSAACYHLRIADKTEAHMATAQASGPVSPWLRPNHRVRVRYRALSHPYPSPQSRIGRISNSMSAVGETTSNAGGGAGQASTPAPRS